MDVFVGELLLEEGHDLPEVNGLEAVDLFGLGAVHEDDAGCGRRGRRGRGDGDSGSHREPAGGAEAEGGDPVGGETGRQSGGQREACRGGCGRHLGSEEVKRLLGWRFS